MIPSIQKQVSDTNALKCTLFVGNPRNYQKRDTTPGADPGILVWGAWERGFFFQKHGVWRSPRKLLNFSDFRLKFNHIGSHQR